MPRQDTPDLPKVNLAPVARQVNTFVQGRRASPSNTAGQLAQALQTGSKIIKGIDDKKRQDHLDQVEVDIQRATDNKLNGGNLFNDTYRDNIADYEEIKGTLKTPEDAAQYFLERNQQTFQDPHEQAGYDAKLKEKFADFRASHNKYLVTEKIKGRNIALTKSFYNDVLDGKTGDAFANMKQAADNYGAKATQTNGLVLESVKAMLAQGRVDKAEEVLNFQRGPAKSLVENPETAEEAGRLLERVVDTREGIKNARFEDLKVQNRVNEEQKIQNENAFYDEVFNDESLTNTQKILKLENAKGNFEISDDFHSTLKRTLTARKGNEGDTDTAVYADIITKVNNLATTSGGSGSTANADYLKGLRNIRVEAEEAIANGSIKGGDDADKLRKQISSLSNKKEAEALASIARIFKTDATKYIDSNVAPENRGHIIKDVFFATEELRAREAEAKEKGEKFDSKAEYLKMTQETIGKFKEKQILKSQEAVSRFKDEDPVGVYMRDNGLTDEDIRAQARKHNTTPERVREKLLEKLQPQGEESQSELKGGMGNDAILEVVGLAESKGNYNIVYDGSATGKEINLTSMSVGEVLEMQAKKRKDGMASTASGKYQFIYKTLKGLVENNGIDKDAKFDESMQDELAGHLLNSRRRKATDENGNLDKAKFAKEIAKEWASMPKDSSGRGYYDGDGLNKSLVPFSKVEEVLASL